MTKTAAAFDFDALDIISASNTPYEYELLTPTDDMPKGDPDKPLGVFVSIYGGQSDQFRNRARQEENRRRKRKFEMERRGKDTQPEMVEEDEARKVELIATLIAGWRTVIDGKSEPIILWKGEKLDFTHENALRWLTRFDWVAGQIDVEAAKIGPFTNR